MRAKAEKSQFLREKIEYLGFEISQNGVLPSQRKCDAIRKIDRPTSVAEIATFWEWRNTIAPILLICLEWLRRCMT